METFKELLKEGLGNRSIQSFAQEVGLSREYISRLLNNKISKKPSWETIEKIATGIPCISADRFFQACDYDEPYIDTKRHKEEESLFAGLKAFTDKRTFFDSVEDFLDMVKILYTTGYFEVIESGDTKEKDTFAEEYVAVSYVWESCGYKGKLPFILYYSVTRKGKYLFTDYTFHTDKLQEYNIISEKPIFPITNKECYHTYIKNTARDLRMDPLIRIIGGQSMPTTEIGFGFYYHKNPEVFLTFLMDHADTFCKKKEYVKLFQQAILPDADFEEIFSKFYLGAGGTGAVIAYIMAEETGLDFCYKESEESSCIMIPHGEDDEIPDDVLRALYKYACELQIDEFGVCYHQKTIFRQYLHWYNTNEFDYNVK